jgi:diacylglycerol kinase family enzyme
MIDIAPERPIHLVINPKSGYGGQRLLLNEVRAEFRRAGIDLVEYTTKAPDDATHYVRGLAGRAAAVMVWGGDGTVNEVAAGLAGSNVPIIPCPCGTENLLAKELHVPFSPHGLLRTVRHGRLIECDSGRINGQNFLLIIGIGFDGEVVRRVAAARTGHISHLSYFWPIWRTFWEHDFPRMRVIVDGQEAFNDYGLAFVGNISRYAVGLRICREAQLDDGLMDLVVFSCREQTRLMMHAAWTLLRWHPLKGDMLYRQFRHCRIETDRPVPSQVDGDVGPNSPFDISVAEGKVHLLAPPE